MQLRTTLLVSSAVIIAFALSLYFQSEQETRTFNWDQYKNLQYSEDRSHSLDNLNQKIHPYELQEIIQEYLERNRLSGQKTRVMEIGAGNGRVLMELKKLFPEVEFYGINKEKTHTFYRRESYILTGLRFEIFNREELEGVELPYVVFQDVDFGESIAYGDNKFDVIFSQSTMNHIKYKFELFNEIMRLLKSEGVSLHTDVVGINIYYQGVRLALKDALSEMRRSGIDIHTLEDAQSIRFKKSGPFKGFPVVPHQPIPEILEGIPQELRRPEMGYTLKL
jgi:SAM-dependent methyltransferase